MTYRPHSEHAEGLLLIPGEMPANLPPLFYGLIERTWDRIKNLLSSINTEAKKSALKSLMYGLYKSTRAKKPLAYSRDHNYYARIKSELGHVHFSYANIVGLIEALKDVDVVNHTMGYFNRSKYIGDRARITASDELAEAFRTIHDDQQTQMCKQCSFIPSPADPDQLIAVLPNESYKLTPARNVIIKKKREKRGKDGKKKKPARTYILNHKTRAMERFLRNYNTQIEKSVIIVPCDAKDSLLGQAVSIFLADIKDDGGYSTQEQELLTNISGALAKGLRKEALRSSEGNLLCYKKLDCRLQRVFNEASLDCGGRYFGGYQSLNKSLRSKMLIDGEPVCEGDFDALHITMLHHKAGVDINGYPYDLLHEPLLIGAVKQLVTIAMNAKTKKSSIKVFSKKLDKNYSSEEKNKKMANIKETLASLGLDVASLFEAYLEKCPVLSDAMKKREEEKGLYIGAELMNIDSAIATDVLKHFHKKGLPCLCMHDSFIVQQKYKEELKEVMQSAYYHHLKFSCNVTFK